MGSLEWVVVTVLGIAVVGACVLLYQLMVQNGRVMLGLEALERQLREQDILPPEGQPLPAGLPAGSVPGDFSLPSLAGETVTLSQCRGRRVLLIFVHPGCGFSARFLAELAPLANAPGNLAAAPLFISRGDPVENRRWFEQHGISFPVLLQEDSEVASLFQVPGTPTGYLLDENGTTVSEMLVGADSLLVELRPAGPSASIPSRLSSRAGAQSPEIHPFAGREPDPQEWTDRRHAGARLHPAQLAWGGCVSERLPWPEGVAGLFRPRMPTVQSCRAGVGANPSPVQATAGADGQPGRPPGQQGKGRRVRFDVSHCVTAALGDFASLRSVRHSGRLPDR